MKRMLAALALILFLGVDIPAQEAEAPFVLKVVISEAITPSSLDRLEQALHEAEKRKARALLVALNTPGGLMSSMDDMIRLILSSPVPVITYVSPPGSYSGSAGVFIMYASHVAAMAPATNIGSATPVSMGGSPEDGSGSDEIPDEAGKNDAVNMKRKTMNHALAQIRSLAEYHGRNRNFAERAITHAENLTSSQALAIRAIDLVAESETQLLERLEGRQVRTLPAPTTLSFKGVRVVELESDTRSKVLALLANPTLAYFLLMLGMLGIWAEIQYPGTIFPGVIGAICFLLGLYAMQTLSVDYTGIALIALALVLFVLEIHVTSYGLLSIAAVASLSLGSLMLMREERLAMSLWIVGSTVATVSALIIFLMFKAGQVMRKKPSSGGEALLGREGTVVHTISREGGQIMLGGEYWSAQTRGAEIPAGTVVKVVERSGLTLMVEPVH